MPPTIDIRTADDVRDVVHRAVQALAEGSVVAFPTETVYGLAASALSEEGVARLRTIKEREESPFALAIKSPEEAMDYVPGLSPLGRRLARRCWPGPVTLVVEDNHEDSLARRLPASVRRSVLHEGRIGLRVPAHQMILDVMALLAGPLALTSANRRGQPEALTADAVASEVGDAVALIIDAGKCRLGQASSVVLVTDNDFEVLRQGVVSEQNLRRLASFELLFVCTGNTCRSPMAECIAADILAAELKCGRNELEDHGFVIKSAGIAAMPGGRASPEAVSVVKKMGIDLGKHQSRPLTDKQVYQADLILTMTNAHREAIVARWPDAASKTTLVCAGGQDVADPIGGTRENYEACASQIKQALKPKMHDLAALSEPRKKAAE